MSEQVLAGILESEEFGNSNGNDEDLGMFVLLTLHLEILLTVSDPDVQKVMDRVTDWNGIWN